MAFSHTLYWLEMNPILRNILVTVGSAFIVSSVATGAATILSAQTQAEKISQLERRMTAIEKNRVRISDIESLCSELASRIESCERSLIDIRSDFYRPRVK